MNHKLAGNIEESLILEDEDNTLLLFLTPVVERYLNTVRVKISDHDKISTELKLETLWVNYQNQHEFNPNHNHFGLISFVIWMKIPTDWKEQHELPFAKNSNGPVASDFQFTYTDIIGHVQDYNIPMDSDKEGVILLFPSRLRHQVYPFYNCDKQRISISGNIVRT